MKRLVAGLAFATLIGHGAAAQTIGVSMALFDDVFLTVLRNGMEAYAATLSHVTLQIENAQNETGRQLYQVQSFLESGVDAIIVNPVDTDAAVSMSQAAELAGVPLVYLNREPINADDLPDDQTLVASDETESGRLEAEAVCRILKEAGKGDGARALVLVGELFNQAAHQRTADVHDVVASDACNFISIVEERPANWSRTQASNLMTNWLSAKIPFDAVIANNDEMAIGAIQAMKADGIDMKDVVVAGIDGTEDALAAMAAGDLDVTVFQNAAGQSQGAIDAALKLIAGKVVERKIYIPFELVTPENLADYRSTD